MKLPEGLIPRSKEGIKKVVQAGTVLSVVLQPGLAAAQNLNAEGQPASPPAISQDVGELPFPTTFSGALDRVVPLESSTEATEKQSSAWFFPETSFWVRDNFLREFNSLGDVNTLGYPVSRPFEKDGFFYQAFQRAILQWRPEENRAVLANVMDWLHQAGKDPELAVRGIPPHFTGDDGAGGNFDKAKEIRLAWLTTDLEIKEAYFRNPNPSLIPNSLWDPVTFYGLPTSRPQKSGPFTTQRSQRYVFQKWDENVPGMPPQGSVVGVLVGDLAKELGLVPAPAMQPEQATTTPEPTPGPSEPEQPPAIKPFEFAYPMGNPWNGVTKEEYQGAEAFVKEWFPPVIEKLRLLNDPEINNYLIMLRDAMTTREIIIAPHPVFKRVSNTTIYQSPFAIGPYVDRNRIRYLLSISMPNAKSVENQADMVSTAVDFIYTVELIKKGMQIVNNNKDANGRYDGASVLKTIQDQITSTEARRQAATKAISFYPTLLRGFNDDPIARTAYLRAGYTLPGAK